MRLAKIIAGLGLVAMTGIIIYAAVFGDLNSEGSALLAMPWGIVSLVDLYVGFFLFSGWIVYREKTFFRAAPWVVLMMVLGFWTASLYVLIALGKSEGNWQRFWLGRRMGDEPN